ncbi:hypothetical protein ABZ370_08305 [Streptomyces sp. NPDC005962]
MRRHLGKLVDKLGRRELALIVVSAMVSAIASAMATLLGDSLF